MGDKEGRTRFVRSALINKLNQIKKLINSFTKKLNMSSKATMQTLREITKFLGHADELLQHTKDGNSED